MTRKKIIIDTDPGIDDVLAILLALAVQSEEVEILLLSVTFGNIDVKSCLRNLLSLFFVVQKESEWRRTHGKSHSLLVSKHGENNKPIVAVGAEQPLADHVHNCDEFHGVDGLGGAHSTMPECSPPPEWCALFNLPVPSDAPEEPGVGTLPSALPLQVSRAPAHEEMLRILKAHPPDTVTIVAIGPLTNCAMAAMEDAESFSRCKEVVFMGGAVDVPGNTTPLAEANVYADPYAAAVIFALTSSNPCSTVPLPPLHPQSGSQSRRFANHWPERSFRALLDDQQRSRHLRPLKLTLFPLDITTRHTLRRTDFERAIAGDLLQGSPLATWLLEIMTALFDKVASQRDRGRASISQRIPRGEDDVVQLHDPLCVWYAITSESLKWRSAVEGGTEDLRIETKGEWAKGQLVTDRRQRPKLDSLKAVRSGGGGDCELSRDKTTWLIEGQGNRVRRIIESPEGQPLEFGNHLLRLIMERDP
ncbi:hypothetical protein A1O1_04574 [Capronia coronata CBS 617.96]|uniref:Inosine/uridine-preferring nucleoside hydrolase domain-containing protein n=1 Tax=Capronia coronata CBS 617.96 TaxID=1182541 RepID=W9YDA0_9EURO|nr:uncharacterized protein A1O1_04574 [Capronia coronata CBS 617.96]EXJ87650.1 hypothetical protein A1O1_04574 [Capronia coronata CBS 617.96]